MTNIKNSGTFFALGTFDGLHTGHKKVITCGDCETRRVLMFKEHPQKVLSGTSPTKLLTESEEKRILSSWGAEPIFLDFKEIADLSPEDFFYKILLEKFGAKVISVGFNYRFGKNASGEVELLNRLCKKNGVKLIINEPVMFENEPVSSTRIRSLIKTGDIEKANKMLGREFSYDFTVFHGDKRGRTIDAPTINQFFEDGFTVPGYGVYVAVTEIDGKKYPSVANIGIRPTIGNSKERSETHILGFSGDLYGRNITVKLLKKIRNEQKFNDLAGLKKQIDKDKKATLQIVAEYLK